MPQQQKRNAQLEDTTRPQGPCPSPQADGDPAVLVAGPHDTPRRAKLADRPADGEPDVNIDDKPTSTEPTGSCS